MSSLNQWRNSSAAPFSSALGAIKWRRAKGMLQQELQDFADRKEETPIRLLTDQRLAGAVDAEVVIQIDEYDFRLRLLETSSTQPQLTVTQLTPFQQSLEANPSTVALLLTWTTNDLLTIPLTIARIRFLQQYPHLLPRLLSQARPLLSVLQELMTRQIKEWEKGLDLSQRVLDEPIDVRQVFATALEDAFKKERKRSYRQPIRKEAAHHFPVDSEKSTMLAVLDEALKGKSAHQLIELLI